MKITINSKQLLTALNICGKAISPYLPATSCYRLQSTCVSACNLELSISAPISAKGKFDILLPAEKLRPYIASLGDTEVTFEWEVLDMLVKISSATGFCQMQGEIGTDFPVIATTNGKEIELDIADLTEAFYRTSYSCLNDATGNTLNGVNVVFNGDGINFATYNGLASFAKFYIAGKHELSNHILPKSFVNSITGAGNCKLNYSDKSISVEHQGIVIKSLLIDGTFLDWQPLVSLPPLTTSVDRLELIQAIKRTLIFSDKLLTQVCLSVSGSKLTITTEDVKLNDSAKEEIECTPVSEDMRIGFNGNFVIEALNHLSCEKVAILMDHPKKPIFFKDINEIGCFAMVAPTALKEVV